MTGWLNLVIIATGYTLFPQQPRIPSCVSCFLSALLFEFGCKCYPSAAYSRFEVSCVTAAWGACDHTPAPNSRAKVSRYTSYIDLRNMRCHVAQVARNRFRTRKHGHSQRFWACETPRCTTRSRGTDLIYRIQSHRSVTFVSLEQPTTTGSPPFALAYTCSTQVHSVMSTSEYPTESHR